MSFFHNLNKTLDGIAARPEAAQLTERDMGKHNNATTGFKALAKKAGGGEKGEKIAGAQFQKMKKAGQIEEEGMSRAAKGYEKYGKEGMQALAKAGRDGKSLDPIRNKYDKYDNKEVDEGLVDVVKKVGGMAKKAGGAVLNKVGHGDDVDMIRDLQRKMGVAPTGKKPEQKTDEAGAPMTAKQKSFAKLAPPTDKITFADKIAGAKKEVDEMLGDVAAEAMRNALGGRQQVADEGNAFTGALAKTPKGGKFKVGGKEFTDTSSVDEEEDLNPFTNYKKPRADTPRTGEVTHGAKHDTKHTATGRIVTRRVDAQGNSVGSETDAEGNTIDKRGRGRPKGPEKGPERTTAKAYKHKGERKVKEGDMEQESDELKAAMTMLKKAGYKVSKAVEEESTHTRDDHAEKAGKRVAKDIEYDEKKKDGIHGKKRGAEDDRAEKAGKKVAKDIEYDDKKDEVKEDEPKKSKSKFKFGGSVYEALDAQLETLITEGMSVTVNMSQNAEDGQETKNITVNADGEDADRLAELLQMAGMSQQSSGCGCGQSPCGCDVIDENDPNWPSNTETSDNALQYSGGLNGPKSTGQTTIPVIAGQEERMGQDDLSRLREMAGMRQDSRLDEGMMDKIKGMLVPKLMKLLGPDAEKIASAVKQATGGDFTPSKENAMKVVQALGIDKAAEQGQSPQMAEGIAGNWQGKLIQALYTLGLLGSAAVTMWASGPGRGTGLGVASGLITVIGVVLLMFANTFFSSDSGMVGAMGRKGRQGFDTNESLNKTEQNLLNLYQTFRK